MTSFRGRTYPIQTVLISVEIKGKRTGTLDLLLLSSAGNPDIVGSQKLASWARSRP